MQPTSEAGSTDSVFHCLLEIAQKELQMDALWISEFVGGKQIFHAVNGNETFQALKEIGASAYDGSYCKRVIDGRLPSVIRDAHQDARTNLLPITDELGIGSYVGVPIKLSDGKIFGMLCGINSSEMNADPPMYLLLALAIAAREAAEARWAKREALDTKRERIERTLAEKRLDVVFQPIIRLSTMNVVGVEALSRFRDAPARPDVWFADAAEVGLEEELELLAIESALRLLPMLPGNIYLSLNVSPQVATTDALARSLLRSESSRLVLEITEQSSVGSYEDLMSALAPLRKAGIRLAVDDAGAGYASFNHILALCPDIIKLDKHLTRNLDQDPVRLSLAEALSSFATRIGAQLVAEGVETQSELNALLHIDAYAVQGYLTGRPGDLPLEETNVRPRAATDLNARPNLTLTNGITFDDDVRRILRAVIEETSLDVAYMTVLHAEDESLEHRYVYPEGVPDLCAGLIIPWRDSLCKRCRDAEVVWTADISKALAPGSYADGKGVQTYLSMPIRTPANHATFGTLCAASFKHRYLSERVVSRVEMLARMIGDRIVRDGVQQFMKASVTQD
ncbi:EAL domain-containing protein [Nodosilinea sp. LEGE 07298]|uniref:EAL domain-containing protein n=1 Tax=Nodosilinea sp. LEGE 07298 TaxID=2777970 RepID=UPI00187E86B0|nr:EAL domain-containing protein [Nodosilinea sp. LEGE 07298]MBE9108168.1 EAL domain-containing protein [Nodosilinea sp. LEGE 07298]